MAIHGGLGIRGGVERMFECGGGGGLVREVLCMGETGRRERKCKGSILRRMLMAILGRIA